MHALWLENQQLSLREVPIPAPPPGEALIKVRLSGICGTDLELVRGYYPYTGIIGHEFVGEVVEAPDASPFGDDAASLPGLAATCACVRCRQGRQRDVGWQARRRRDQCRLRGV